MVGGKSTGTYRVKTGSNGLTTMPGVISKGDGRNTLDVPQAHALIDVILVVAKGSEILYCNKKTKKILLRVA